mmetsp:Transcript_1247/g.1776  ORF Transcript_1247/g.1776 Transcript_1247/m.1776 type:complete len:275 (-) Transcript_1247:192-1016(-)
MAAILNQQHPIYTTIILRVICDLRVFTPNHFSSRCDQAQLADIYLDNGSFGEYSKLRVHVSIGVLLNTNDVQLKCTLELGVRDVGLGEAHSGGPDEPLVLWRLSCEPLTHKSCLGDHSLPGLLHPLARAQHLEHLVLSNGPHLGKRNFPLPSFLLPLLLDCVTQYFSSCRLLTIQQICRHCSLRSFVFHFVLVITFAMLLNSFLHRNLLLEPFFSVHLTFQTNQLLSHGGFFFNLTRSFLTRSFFMIQLATISLLMQLNIISLRHVDCSRLLRR